MFLNWLCSNSDILSSVAFTLLFRLSMCFLAQVFHFGPVLFNLSLGIYSLNSLISCFHLLLSHHEFYDDFFFIFPVWELLCLQSCRSKIDVIFCSFLREALAPSCLLLPVFLPFPMAFGLFLLSSQCTTPIGLQFQVFCWSFLGCLSKVQEPTNGQGHMLCTCLGMVSLLQAADGARAPVQTGQTPRAVVW